MIYDRTQSDIENAKIARAKIQAGETLSDSDKEYLLRGTLTIDALNRIENKTKELDIGTNNAFYIGKETQTKEWGYEDYFKQSDADRWIENLQKLKDRFFVYEDTVFPSANYLDFKNVNNIEKMLFDVGEILSEMVSLYKICGKTECGE